MGRCKCLRRIGRRRAPQLPRRRRLTFSFCYFGDLSDGVLRPLSDVLMLLSAVVRIATKKRTFIEVR
jgi:hypothetical protein